MDLAFLLGLALLCGYLAGQATRRLKLPAVVGYILIGLLLGQSFFNLFHAHLLDTLGIISDVTLALVGFIIGCEMRMDVLRRQGKGLAAIILLESFGAFFVVAGFTYLLTHKWYMALLFGAMAPASAPAGTVAVLQEYRAKGPLTNTLLSVVGLDDGLAIGIYGFAAALAKSMLEKGNGFSLGACLVGPAQEIVGSLLLGVVVGFVLVTVLRRIRHKNEMLIVSLGAVLCCAGVSNMLHLSLILSCLTLGFVAVNTNAHATRKAFESIEGITSPIYVIFFIMAGAHLQISLLPAMGFLGLLYIIGRSVGLIGGAYLGATISKAEDNIRKYLGFGILSQAGVAVGLALIVVKEFSPLGPEGEYVASLIINTIAATTIIFEIIGPITTKIAIHRAGEVGQLK